MSPDPLREQLSFLEKVDPDSHSLRSRGPERRSKWPARLVTATLLTAQVALLGVFLHFTGRVRIPGLPAPDAFAAAPAAPEARAALPKPMGSGVVPAPPVATSVADWPRAIAPRAPIARATPVPKSSADDFATLPLRMEDAGSEEDAGPAPEATRTEEEEEKKARGAGRLGRSPISEKRKAEIERKRLAQRKREEYLRSLSMTARKQEEEYTRQWREMIRLNTPTWNILNDPNGQFMGAVASYPNGSRVHYDRNRQIRQMDVVFPDGTRQSVSRDNLYRWNW